MANVIINDAHLTDIADAIREKNGETTTYKPGQMADAILAITTGGGDMQPISLTSNIDYYNYAGAWDWFISKYKTSISTTNIESAVSSFNQSKLTEVPFTLNLSTTLTAGVDLSEAFRSSKIQTAPTITGRVKTLNNTFANSDLITIPDDWASNIDWSRFADSNGFNKTFTYCQSLRKIPRDLFAKQPESTSTYQYWNAHFDGLFCLDELYLPIRASILNYSSFGTGIRSCYRLKDILFETNTDGTPKTLMMKNQNVQIVDVGFAPGYTADQWKALHIENPKVINSQETYRLYKNEPDACVSHGRWSRYNHASAVRTINSLPDCSAWGTNTLTFQYPQLHGPETDEGSVYDLTDAEIAVAAAKGWTIAYTDTNATFPD